MINCDKITKDTKDVMFSLIDKSEKREREHLVKLCEEKNGDITHSNFCTGSPIKYPDKDVENGKLYADVSIKKIETCICPTGTRLIGDFHTHPFTRNPSSTDIVSTASTSCSSLCIGNRSHEWIEEVKGFRYVDNITCYDIIDKELLRLGDEAQEIAQKGDITKAKRDIIPMMLDRIKNVQHGRILKTKCKMRMIRP